MNRITDAIANMTNRLKTISAAKRKQLDAGLTLDVGHNTFNARAHAEGVLSTDEAQTIHNAIRDWDNQSVPAKIVVTQSITELLAGQIAASEGRRAFEDALWVMRGGSCEQAERVPQSGSEGV